MAERLLGLDVGTGAVRVVEVVVDRPRGSRSATPRSPAPPRSRVVSRVGEVPLPPGAVRDGEVVDPAAVGAAIRDLWRQTGLRGREVRVGLTGSRVVVRVLDLPAMPDDELAGAVRFSASDHIPIPLDEAVWDYTVLEPSPVAVESDGSPMVRVLVAATHRSALDGLLAGVAAGGLRASAVDLVPFALIRGLGSGSGDSPRTATDPVGEGAEAIVSIGAGLTTVVVHEAGRPRIVRTVAVGGDMLTAAIGVDLGLAPDAAEALKRAAGRGESPGGPGAGPEGDLTRRAARITELRLAGILGEIQSSLAYWMAESERPLRRIVLTGGGARAGDIAGRLSLLVGVPVEWGALSGLEAPEPAAGAGDWADHTVAAGLALGGAGDQSWQINLGPPVRRAFRLTGATARALAAAAVVALVGLGGLSVRAVTTLGAERHRLAAQQRVNHKVEAELAQYEPIRHLGRDLDTGRAGVKAALAGDVSWTRFLSEFVRSMPQDTWISSLNAQTTPATPPAQPAGGLPAPAGIGSLQVAATGLGYPAVADWLRMLAADPSLAGLGIGGLSAADTAGQRVVNFTSTANITPAAHSGRGDRLARAAL